MRQPLYSFTVEVPISWELASGRRASLHELSVKRTHTTPYTLGPGRAEPREIQICVCFSALCLFCNQHKYSRPLTACGQNMWLTLQNIL